MTDSPAPDGSLEQALADLEAHAESTARALMAAAKAAKRVQSAAATGLLRDVAQGIDAAARLAAEAAGTAADLRSGWSFDGPAYLASGEYTKEVLASAADAGLQMVELDDRLLCYPSIVSVSPADVTVVIDKKKDRRLRPSVVVGHLAAIQQRPPKFKPEPFLEALAKAYDLITPRPGATVKLVDAYGALTLLPGASRDYTKPEFARDLYLLDQSGITTTKDGREMSLPASALTRGSGVLTTVAKGGQVKVYAGLSFDRRSA
jgi:hypothetical protein